MLILEIALGVTLGSIITEVIASIVVVVRKKRAVKRQTDERQEFLDQLDKLSQQFEAEGIEVEVRPEDVG